MDQLRTSSAEYELTGLEDRDEDTGTLNSSSHPIMHGRKGKTIVLWIHFIDTT